eukprot:TRINITY_DN1101_c0_g1_i2.p1 TRINITY_DN1101_c0_g1~~TRINITY_DN1101_c0_g1_i2.p1  ORF type:complete len:146 (-),score=28.60 TRINITY_DN1101_c0_g1_i2:423-860(-)
MVNDISCLIYLLDPSPDGSYDDNVYNPEGVTTEGHLLVYSVGSRSSFEECKKRLHQMRHTSDDGVLPPLVICANKVDLGEEMRKVTREEGESLSRSFEVPLFETSAKTPANVDEAYAALVEEVRRKCPLLTTRTTRRSNTRCSLA